MYVAEYNPKQKQFHIEKKLEKEKKVLKAIQDDNWKNESEWMVFAEGEHEECRKCCDFLRNILNL